MDADWESSSCRSVVGTPSSSPAGATSASATQALVDGAGKCSPPEDNGRSDGHCSCYTSRGRAEATGE